MEITQQDIDGLAAKIGELELTEGEAAALEAISHIVSESGDEVEGFYLKYELTNWKIEEGTAGYQTGGSAGGGLRADPGKLSAGFAPVLGFSFGVERE